MASNTATPGAMEPLLRVNDQPAPRFADPIPAFPRHTAFKITLLVLDERAIEGHGNISSVLLIGIGFASALLTFRRLPCLHVPGKSF
jgi:hypothetical protein